MEVITLQSFIEENQIDDIEYFHCDVQGKDLEVLMGMGEHITKIKAGVIEMPTSHDNKLYKDQKYIHTDAIEYLQERGFEISEVQDNDCWGNEVNIHFRRSQHSFP